MFFAYQKPVTTNVGSVCIAKRHLKLTSQFVLIAVARLRTFVAVLLAYVVVALLPCQLTLASDVYAQEARRFIEIQRNHYNAMLTGQSRLKRACSVPFDASPNTTQRLPDLSILRQTLVTESGRFTSRATTRLSAARRDQAVQCKNPVGKVLELFGVKSGCSEAEITTKQTQQILKAATDWETLLESQLKVLSDARTLEAKACLSPGFTAKLIRAYTDSVRPQGTPLSKLFDRWTSAR